MSTWLFVAAVIGVLYVGVIYVPPWLDNMSVKEAVQIGLNKAQHASEEQIAEQIIQRLNLGPDAVGYHFEEGEDGQPVEVRGLGLQPENVSVLRDESARRITITVDYVRLLRLKPSQKITRVNFHVEKEQPLQ